MQKSNNITSGPITRTVISLALPVTIGMFMQFALSSTDYFWVGKLGATAQDAVTTSMVITWTIYAVFSMVTVGVTALVSRFVGARDLDKVQYYIKQGMAMSLILGAAVSVVGYFGSPALISFMGAGGNSLALAVPYIRIFFASTIIYFIIETVYAVFRASGDTKTPTLVGIGIVVINLVLDPLLIFGIGPFPELGVAGASLASAISILIGTVIIVVMLLRGKLGYHIDEPLRLRPKIPDMLRIGRIGLPMATQQFVFVFVYWFLIKIVHEFGESAGAAMGIGNRMESFAYLTAFGFSVAAATMVGQNLGAGKPDRAARCAWGATGIAVLLSFAVSILFITIPKLIAGIFTDDPLVMTIAVDYLIILGLSQVAMAVEIVIEGAFGGAGDTIPPMVVMLQGAIIRIPMAYYLCFTLDWGINGVWWTLTITSILKAIVISLWFRRGKWKLKEI